MACYHTMDPALGRLTAEQTQPGLFHWKCNYYSCSFYTIATQVEIIHSHLHQAHKLTTNVWAAEITAHGDILCPQGFIPTPFDQAEDMWPGELAAVHRMREGSVATNSSGASSTGEETMAMVRYLWDRKLGWMSEHPAGVRMWNCAKAGCGFKTVAKRVRMIQYHLWKESGVFTSVDLKEATVKGEEWVA